jgi:hypothetical protein
MDHLANAAALAQAQERLHDLGVPRMSADPIDLQVEAELAALEEAFAGQEVGVDTTQERSREPGIFDRWAQDPNPVGASASAEVSGHQRVPKHFRVSNNLRSSTSDCGFSKKFVEHGCYSIDVWDVNTPGGRSRMQQHQDVEVGDVLWLPESQKNDRVYRGVVKIPFRRIDSANPSFFIRDDVLEIVRQKSHSDTEYPRYQDVNPMKRKEWLDGRCEYICQVEWSGPVKMDKSVLNEGFICKTIASRNEEQSLALDSEFYK